MSLVNLVMIHWLYWRQDLHHSPEQAAKKHLTCSAASAVYPMEIFFSVTEILFNGKLSSLALHRANCLTFIHKHYFHIKVFKV